MHEENSRVTQLLRFPAILGKKHNPILTLKSSGKLNHNKTETKPKQLRETDQKMVKVLKLTECLCNKYYVKGSSGRGRQHELTEGELNQRNGNFKHKIQTNGNANSENYNIREEE